MIDSQTKYFAPTEFKTKGKIFLNLILNNKRVLLYDEKCGKAKQAYYKIIMNK
jgi:hypothetical protein